MKIETTTTVKHEVELNVPSFWRDEKYLKYGINDVIGLLDEKTVCRVYESQLSIRVSNQDAKDCHSEIVKAFHEWQPITEEEFLQAYNRALHSMSLTPELSKETGAMAD